jgi:DNA-binding CsgD family transcriptional regulator
MTPLSPNPWGLTQRECDALAALVSHRDIQAAGKAIGVSYSQVTSLIANAKKRMKASGLIDLVLEWDRWTRDGEFMDDAQRLVLTDTVVDLVAQCRHEP